MSKALFTLALLASALTLTLTAHADAIDDFVLKGGGNTITFSLPASPPGNLSTCPVGIIESCQPGYLTDFIVSTLVTDDNVTTLESIEFPFSRLGGMSFGFGEFFGDLLFTPNAGTPTFLTGSFSLYIFVANQSLPVFYTLTITPETATATPEPSTLALLTTGTFGLIAFAARRKTAHHFFN
jgi:hypothetical protein